MPQMVHAVEGMWAEGDERASLHRMHDFWHQGLNILLHHSARSLNYGYSVDATGKVTFSLGASTDLVPLALGFAFWTYANMVSLTVERDDLAKLTELAAQYSHVMPDAWLRHLIAEAKTSAEAETEMP